MRREKKSYRHVIDEVEILVKEAQLSSMAQPVTLSLVMPVSGPKIANQIAVLKRLLAHRYKPDIIFGSSGGCITAALSGACDMNSIKCQDTYQAYCDKLSYVLSEMTSDWYCKPRSSFSFINTIMGVAAGSLFDRGNGAEVIKEYAFDFSNQPEMWFGTHCKTTAKQQLFCTKSYEESQIKIKGAKYLNGDIAKIVEVVIASSAVPTIVPPIMIDGQLLADGGVGYASPLGPCMKAFHNGCISYHVIYISPMRYSNKDDPQDCEIEDDDIVNKMKSSTTGMVTNIHIADRNNGIRYIGPDAIKRSGKGADALVKALKKQKQVKRSFIEITPRQCTHVNFVNMDKGDVLEAVNEAYGSDIIVRHWYC